MDWTFAIVALVFAIQGARQGTIRQVMTLAGVFGGFGSAWVVSQWVAAHWHGARPAAVFWVLRWVVAILAGCAVASLFTWLGGRLREGIKTTDLGWLDRLGGLVFGAGLGACLSCAALIGLLLTPWPRGMSEEVRKARVTAPLLSGAESLLDHGDRYIPGGSQLHHLLQSAERRERNPRTAS
ncbi:MAG TPA: CvpA family protein [Candidatus Sulfotelmatobacter sp.]|nr:CvpA family protein [Candidatus Sulfotelmatobacter sp.]